MKIRSRLFHQITGGIPTDHCHTGVVMWTGAEILDWYRTQVPAARAA